MHLGLRIAIGVLVVAVASLVALMLREGAANRRFYRDVAKIAQGAGYAPFGATGGPLLSFRSATSYLQVVRGGHGAYITLLLARRGRQWAAEPEWVDDDLLRQVLLHEEGDPMGMTRVWHDRQAFVSFMREHLPDIAAVISTTDAVFESALARAREERHARWQRHRDEVSAEAERRRAGKGRR